MDTLFEILAREQALGEGHARLLCEQGRDDPQTYAMGIIAYVDAKAAFDVLIEGAKTHLIADRDLTEVEGFRARVESAVAQRAAFTDLVRSRLIVLEGATRFGLPAALDVGKLVKGLIDSLLAVLKAFREADETRRRETLARLDALKWRPFEAMSRD
ncbi:hypothetical protein [uncultured Thiodictyon sp.]|uniref:hypothetical protein n=1 Tax=uncultured Thiodictyon sp. TaxID=1846217 RepID=UPI0025E1C6D4|nr:hypothetical protein [uncultured Thiodictyon sp.]